MASRRHFDVFAALLLMVAGCKLFAPAEPPLSSVSGTRQSCHQVLTEPEEVQLLVNASKLVDQSLSGQIDDKQRSIYTEKLLEAHASNPQRHNAAKATIAKASDLASSAWLMPVILNWEPGQSVPPHIAKALESFGVPKDLAQPYLEDVASYFADPYGKMQMWGASFQEGSWSFRKESLNLADLRKDPQLISSFVVFLGPSVTARLLDGTRTEALISNDTVFLPPINNDVTIHPLPQWKDHVKTLLTKISSESERFIRSSKESSSYSNLMTGRVIEWFGGERGHEGKTSPEIEMESAYKALLRHVTDLRRKYGVHQDLRKKLHELLFALNSIERDHLEAGLNRLAMAEKAAIAAPFIPALMFAAPYAGAVAAPTWAPVIANATAAGALMPMAFTVGSAAVSASIKSSTLGGEWLCHFHDQFLEKGAANLYAAPFMAAIPVATSFSAAGVATLSNGAVGVAISSGLMNLGLAIDGVRSLVTAGISELSACYSSLTAANDASSSGDEHLVATQAARAYEQCLQGGLDLGFSIAGGGKLTASAHHAIRHKGSKHLKTRGCFGLSVNCETDIRGREPATPDELQAHVTNSKPLHANISNEKRTEVIKDVPLEIATSAPGHDYLRRPESVVLLGRAIATSSDKGRHLFGQGEKIILNVYTDKKAQVTGVEVLDGNHRFAAGIYAESIQPGHGWKNIGDIPPHLIEVRVNGYDTNGRKLPRWIPLGIARESKMPTDSWREIPPEWGARGPTAEISGDIPSTSDLFMPSQRGVPLRYVVTKSLTRIGVSLEAETPKDLQ